MGLFGNRNTDKDLDRLQRSIKVERMYSRGRSDHMGQSLVDLMSQTRAMVAAGRTQEAIELLQESRTGSDDPGEVRWSRVAQVAEERLSATRPDDPELRDLYQRLEDAWAQVYLVLWLSRDPDSEGMRVMREALKSLVRRAASNGKRNEVHAILAEFRRDGPSQDHEIWEAVLADISAAA